MCVCVCGCCVCRVVVECVRVSECVCVYSDTDTHTSTHTHRLIVTIVGGSPEQPLMTPDDCSVCVCPSELNKLVTDGAECFSYRKLAKMLRPDGSKLRAGAWIHQSPLAGQAAMWQSICLVRYAWGHKFVCLGAYLRTCSLCLSIDISVCLPQPCICLPRSCRLPQPCACRPRTRRMQR